MSFHGGPREGALSSAPRPPVGDPRRSGPMDPLVNLKLSFVVVPYLFVYGTGRPSPGPETALSRRDPPSREEPESVCVVGSLSKTFVVNTHRLGGCPLSVEGF